MTSMILRTVALIAATVAVWFAWLGWDTEYQVDPVTGTASGPYTAWQVAGCVLTLVALLVAAVLLGVPWWAAAVAMTLSFTTAWTIHAARIDETGLFLVGTILVGFGMAVGTVVVGLITSAIRRRR